VTTALAPEFAGRFGIKKPDEREVTIRRAARALLAGAAALILAACSDSAGHGPLVNQPGVGVCWRPHAGGVLSFSAYIAENTGSSRITLTGASLTGTRDIIIDGDYADVLATGDDAFGASYSHLPASLRHPVAGTVVPVGDSFQVIFTITARSPAALASAERVTYAYRGQSYVTTGGWFAGWKPDAGC
jgi:hypothetical protein